MKANPLEKKRILIEASKLSEHTNDGCKRYVIELLKGLKRLELQWQNKWEIDIYVEGRTFPLKDISPTQFPFKPFEGSKAVATSLKKNTILSAFKLKTGTFLKKTLSSASYNRLVNYKHQQYHLRKRTENRIRDVLKKTYFQVKGIGASQHNYDLIHLPLPVHFGFPYSKKTQFLTTIHDFTHLLFPEFHLPINIYHTEKGIQYALKRNSSWIAISRSTKDDLIKYCKVSPDKVFTIHEAADREQFKSEFDEAVVSNVLKKYNIPNKTYFLSLSTLEPRKNITNIIKAFNLLLTENPDFDIYMIVSGKIGWKMTDLLNGTLNKKNDRIIFTGFVDDEDLPKLYSKARALTYVSYYEGFGLPPLEAMSCGTPVVYGNNSSQIEIVGDSGLAADPKSITDIKNQMYKLYTDEELFVELKQRALKRSAMFTWDRCVDETISCYNTLLSS